MVDISDEEFELLRKYIKEQFGVSLGDEKKSLVTGRLGGRITQLGFNNFTDYYNYLAYQATRDEVEDLANRITTNHTYFMREADHFEYFGNIVLPWIEKSFKERELRIWSAGCSSGQEAYTLAMIIDEVLSNKKHLWKTDILATDISTRVLQKALSGVYTLDEIKSIPEKWIKKHMVQVDSSHYSVSKELKRELVIRQFNLMDRVFPFKRKFQTVFCRNVMIYFDEGTKAELVKRFYDIIECGGYLFIGKTESISNLKSGFKQVLPAIYRKE